MTDGSENAIVGWLLNFRIRMFVKSAEKKVNPFQGFCRLSKDHSLKKWEKHRTHTLFTC